MNMKETVERWRSLKDENTNLNAQVEHNKKIIEELEREILDHMEQTEMDKISAGGYTFTKTEKLLPKVVDFEALINFIGESGNTALLQRRVGQRAFQEFFESYGFYPEGLDAHITTVLSARKG